MKLPALRETCATGAAVFGVTALLGIDPLRMALGYAVTYCLVRALELAMS
jgi:hypothetical protein